MHAVTVAGAGAHCARTGTVGAEQPAGQRFGPSWRTRSMAQRTSAPWSGPSMNRRRSTWRSLLVKLGPLGPEPTTRPAPPISRPTVPRQNPNPQNILMEAKLGLPGPELTTRPASQSLVVKRGLLSSRSTVPQQKPDLAEYSVEGPHMARPVPQQQQSRNLVNSPGLLVSHSTVPRQNPNSQYLLAKLGHRGPQRLARPVPPLQQSQNLLAKPGLQGVQCTVP